MGKDRMSFDALIDRYRGLLARAGHNPDVTRTELQRTAAEALTVEGLQRRWRELYTPAVAAMAPDVLDAYEAAEHDSLRSQAARTRASASALTAAQLTMSALELEAAIAGRLVVAPTDGEAAAATEEPSK